MDSETYLDNYYNNFGYAPYFAHAEFEWSGNFSTEREAIKELTRALKTIAKDGSVFWAIRHPSKPWKTGTWPSEKPR